MGDVGDRPANHSTNEDRSMRRVSAAVRLTLKSLNTSPYSKGLNCMCDQQFIYKFDI